MCLGQAMSSSVKLDGLGYPLAICAMDFNPERILVRNGSRALHVRMPMIIMNVGEHLHGAFA